MMDSGQLVLNGGVSQSSTMGTDILQVADILADGNNETIAFDGTTGLYVDNQSPDDFLVELLSDNQTGYIQILVKAWSDAAITSPSSFMQGSFTDLNGPGHTLPLGFARRAMFTGKCGYLLVTASADPFQYMRGHEPNIAGGNAYCCITDIVAPGADTAIIDPRALSTNLHLFPVSTRTIDLMNLDQDSEVSFTWSTLTPQAQGLPLYQVTGGADANTNRIYMPPLGSLSLDVDLRGRGLPFVSARSESAINARVQVLLRGT